MKVYTYKNSIGQKGAEIVMLKIIGLSPESYRFTLLLIVEELSAVIILQKPLEFTLCSAISFSSNI